MATHREVAGALARLQDHRHPLKNPTVMAKLAATDPALHAQVQAIAADPTLAAIASGQTSFASTPTAADPTGTNIAGEDDHLGYGNSLGRRLPQVRHVLLGFASLALGAAASGVAKATPNVDFKPNRLIAIPTVLFNGTIASVQSGVRPQYVSSTAEDLDMYQPGSYGGELDLDPVPGAIPINATLVNNGGGTSTFYGAFVGTAVGMPYRRMTSKLMDGSLGTSGSVSAAGTGTLTLTPQIGYTARKVLFTPGAAFSDYFVITNISAGIQPQLMSGDPIPASVFNDLYPLFVDFDRVNAAIPLTFSYTNVAATAGVLKGSTRGDVDQADLATYRSMRTPGRAG